MLRATYEVANELGIHPTNLLLHLKELGAEFEQIWPQIDEVWIEAIRSGDRVKFGLKHEGSNGGPNVADQRTWNREHPILGEHCQIILDKLYRHDKWGNVSIGTRDIARITHLQIFEVEEAVEKLSELRLLESRKHGTFSLDPSKNQEIIEILRQRRPGESRSQSQAR